MIHLVQCLFYHINDLTWSRTSSPPCDVHAHHLMTSLCPWSMSPHTFHRAQHNSTHGHLHKCYTVSKLLCDFMAAHSHSSPCSLFSFARSHSSHHNIHSTTITVLLFWFLAIGLNCMFQLFEHFYFKRISLIYVNWSEQFTHPISLWKVTQINLCKCN